MRIDDNIDVLVITALRAELEAAKVAATAEALSGAGVSDWTQRTDAGANRYWLGTYRTGDGRSLSVALARPAAMGGVNTSVFASTMVAQLKPLCLAMSGVCAGNPDETHMGDVVVADMAYEWDEGKHSPEGFSGEHRQIPLDPAWLPIVQDFEPSSLPSYGEVSSDEAKLWILGCLETNTEPRDHPARSQYIRHGAWPTLLAELERDGLITRAESGIARLTEAGRTRVQRHRYDNVDGPSHLPFAVRVGPIASGSAVMADGRIWDALASMGVRKVAAVEMEATAIARVAHQIGCRGL